MSNEFQSWLLLHTIGRTLLTSQTSFTELSSFPLIRSTSLPLAIIKRETWNLRPRIQLKMPGYDYTDYATVNVVSDMSSSSGSSSPCPKRKGPRGGVKVPFPLKLHKMLEENLYEDIVQQYAQDFHWKSLPGAIQFAHAVHLYYGLSTVPMWQVTNSLFYCHLGLRELRDHARDFQRESLCWCCQPWRHSSFFGWLIALGCQNTHPAPSLTR